MAEFIRLCLPPSRGCPGKPFPSGGGEYDGTAHVATADGDCYGARFTGTGAALFGGRDDQHGSVDFSVDGAFRQRVDLRATGALAVQQRLFAVHDLARAEHTIKACKQGGATMDVDRIDVLDLSTINDDSAGITYSGPGWEHLTGRSSGDLAGDVHATTRDGDSASFTFEGTGVEFFTATDATGGVIEVSLDGVTRDRLFATSSTLASQHTVLRLRGLLRASHVLTLTKAAQSGNQLIIDGFRVFD